MVNTYKYGSPGDIVNIPSITVDAVHYDADSVTTADGMEISADALTTGNGLAVTTTSADLTSGTIAELTETVSAAAPGDRTGSGLNIEVSRTKTGTSLTTADDFDAFSVTRTAITTGAGGTMTAAGSVAKFTNVSTQTAGTLTHSANVVEIVQDSDSTGPGILITGAKTGINIGAASTASIVFDSSDGKIVDAASSLTIYGGNTAADALVLQGNSANATEKITITGATGTEVGGNFSIASTGTFTTGTGNVTIKGDMSIDADHNFDMSSGSGTFATGTGTVSLDGDTTVAAGKTLYIRDASQSIASASDDLMTLTAPTITVAGATKINLDGPTTITGVTVMDSAMTSGNYLDIGNGTSATLAGAAKGITVDFDGVTLDGQALTGIEVLMPGTYTAGTEYAGYFSGDGTIVAVCSDDAAALTIGGTVTTGLSIGAAATGLTFTGGYTTAAIQLGTAGSMMTLAAHDDHAIDINTTSASDDGVNSVRPLHMISTMTGAGGVGGRAEFQTTISAALGSWANALKGYTVITDTVGSVSGLGSAIVSELLLPATALSTGTYAVNEMELVTQASGVYTSPVSFMWCQVSGNQTAMDTWDDTGYVMTLVGLSEGTGNVFSVGAGGAAVAATLRIKVGDTPYYVMLSTAEAN